jgi:nucleotidyltransferase substrate binding protein (TIGR01987 family)
MSEIKIKNKIKNLSNALARLEEVCQQPLDKNNIVLDATVQRFEFTYELFWKTLKLLLEEEGIIATTPKGVLREAYQVQWIADEKLWLTMLEDRNRTSHIYSEKEAAAIYERIKLYFPEMKKVFDELCSKRLVD